MQSSADSEGTSARDPDVSLQGPTSSHRSDTTFGTREQLLQFFSGLVDELRRVFPSFTTLSNLMIEETRKSKEVPDTRLAQSMKQQIREIQALLDDASKLLRLAHGKSRLEVQSITVSDLVGRLQEALRPTAWVRGVLIDMSLGDGLPESVQTDVESLQKAVECLVDYVACSCERELSFWIGTSGGRLVLRVESDQGREGLDSTKPLFSPLQGAAPSRLDKSGARPVALLLSQELVRSLGGDLAFDPGSPAAYELGIPMSATASSSSA